MYCIQNRHVKKQVKGKWSYILLNASSQSNTTKRGTKGDEEILLLKS